MPPLLSCVRAARESSASFLRARCDGILPLCSRFAVAVSQSPFATVAMGYNNYTAKFKLSVIEFAEEKGNCAAAKHFNVNESHVRYWKKRKSSLQNTKPGRRAFRGPKQGKFPAVEEELLKHVQQMRSSCLAVSCEMLQFEARKIAHEKGIPAAAFKASRGWVTRFMRRHQLSLRRRTTLCQRLPQDYEEKIVLFHRFVIGLR